MIGSHSECICTPESPFKINVLRQPSLTRKDRGDIDVGLLMDSIRSDWKFKIWALDLPEFSADEIDSYQTLFRFIVSSYGRKNGKPDSHIWIDHTPSNIKYAHLLKSFFTKAKFIHIVRDGRAVAASIIPLVWGPNTVSGAARSWVKKVSQCLAIESSLGDNVIMRVRYEDLVADPVTILRSICLFLDIPYQPQMIMGTGYRVPAYTADQHSLLGKEPDAKRATAWERELMPRQVEIFESMAGRLLLSLGYTLKYDHGARRMNVIEQAASLVREAYKGKIINRIHQRRRIKRGISATGK
ncbi:MAG: sulfotransferase [Nitrospirae bacterium]|nr:sulfotransferase [Nitrospirota bacterium]